MVADGLTKGTSGNLSIILRHQKRILITPSGVPYDELDIDDISVLTLDGRHVDGLPPSSEAPMHCALYRRRIDLGAIAHTHSHFATVFSILRKPIEPSHYMILFGGRQIRVAPYACYGTDELAHVVADTLQGDHCVLLANHGLVAVGDTLPAAYKIAQTIEEVAALHYHAEQAGGAILLTPQELDEAELRLKTYAGAPH